MYPSMSGAESLHDALTAHVGALHSQCIEAVFASEYDEAKVVASDASSMRVPSPAP